MSIRQATGAVAHIIGMAAVLCWFLIFAYADWLRFSSPTAPNPQTGQIVYEKAIKGVFYITEAQAWWVQKSLLPVWLTAAGAIVTSAVLAKGDPRNGPPVLTVVGWIWTALMLALLFFGDHVMALVLTGSLILPSRPG